MASLFFENFSNNSINEWIVEDRLISGWNLAQFQTYSYVPGIDGISNSFFVPSNDNFFYAKNTSTVVRQELKKKDPYVFSRDRIIEIEDIKEKTFFNSNNNFKVLLIVNLFRHYNQDSFYRFFNSTEFSKPPSLAAISLSHDGNNWFDFDLLDSFNDSNNNLIVKVDLTFFYQILSEKFPKVPGIPTLVDLLDSNLHLRFLHFFPINDQNISVFKIFDYEIKVIEISDTGGGDGTAGVKTPPRGPSA